MKKNAVEASLVLTGLVLATLLINLTDADFLLAGLLYSGDGQWPGVANPFWQKVYAWAPYPGLILGIASALALVGGFFHRAVGRWRRQALFLVLLLLLGPGLLVNVLLKDNLGRARPREVVEFGGHAQFSHPWEPGATGSNSSFPSGHASIGYYLIGPWFLLRRRREVLATAVLAGGLGYGSLVGVARVVQGGHFLSDVLWAGGLVYLVGVLLIIPLEHCGEAQPRSRPVLSDPDPRREPS